jgi:putative addiction module killer protein
MGASISRAYGAQGISSRRTTALSREGRVPRAYPLGTFRYRRERTGHRGKKQRPPQTRIDNGIIYVTIEMMVDIREYHDRGGHSPFRDWYDRLNAEAARKVTTVLYRVGLGNFSNAKSVGAGVYQCKVNFGPGYRVYFGKEGEQIIILLGGGTKQRQQNDIKFALERWEDYRQRNKQQREKEKEEE